MAGEAIRNFVVGDEPYTGVEFDAATVTCFGQG